MRVRKSQAGLDYIIFVTFMFGVLFALSYLVVQSARSSSTDTSAAEADRITTQMLSAAEQVHDSAGAARRTLDLRMPELVTRMYVENGTLLFVELASGKNTLTYQSSVELIMNMRPEDATNGRFVLDRLPNGSVTISIARS